MTIITKLFELYSAKLSAMETMLRENNPDMYLCYSEKLEEFKKKNEEHFALRNATVAN